MTLPAEVQALLDAQPPGRFSATAEGKVKCELNGHTFPARVDALQAFLNGKKYAKLVAAADLDTQLAKYEPFIVKSRNLPGMLFCALTGELLNARMNEVKQHLKGKKFARAKERFQADEQELLEEPELEGGSDMDEDGQEGSEGPGFWVPDEVLQEYEMGDAEAEAGEEAAAGAADVGAADEEQQPAAAGKGKGGKGKAGKAAAEKQQQEQQQQQDKPQRQRKGKGSGAAENGSAKGGSNQQKQQGAAAGGGKQAAAAGKGKAPKAKKARTG